MKAKHKDLTPIELVLLTWYKPDNPLYKNPEHPTIKLAGEIGELLDLYAKHKYKPGFDWENCKWCEEDKNWHSNNNNRCNMSKLRIGLNLPRSTIAYTPLVVDEIGDWTYYQRILEWMKHQDLEWTEPDEIVKIITRINLLCAEIAYDFVFNKNINYGNLRHTVKLLDYLLQELNITYDEIIQLNYQKLNSEPTNHGWKNAR